MGPGRPKIVLQDGKIYHIDYKGDKIEARIVMRKTLISIGCTDITPEAMRHIHNQYNRAFDDPFVVVQEGQSSMKLCDRCGKPLDGRPHCTDK